jgi:hypothetical protein
MSRARIFAAIFGLALAFGPSVALAQEKPPAKKPQKEKKVWTNDDLEALRATVPLSAPGPGTAASAPTAEEAPEGGAAAAGEGEAYSRQNDPAWYRQRASSLRAELDRLDNEIRRLQNFKSNPSSGSAGLALGKDNLSLTPENQIEQLQARRRQVQQELDDLETEARRKGWAPGTIR